MPPSLQSQAEETFSGEFLSLWALPDLFFLCVAHSAASAFGEGEKGIKGCYR